MSSKQQKYFIDLKEAPKFTQMDGLETTVLTGTRGENMMMVLNSTLPGFTVPMHRHPNEQLGMVYSGEAILRIGDQQMHVKKGDFFYIPPNLPHGDTALGDEPFVMLDIFYPVRQDFIDHAREGK